MAYAKNIKINKYNKEGIEVQNAYHRIINFEGMDDVRITIGIYWSREDFYNRKQPIDHEFENFIADYSDNAQNLKKQAYEYIMNLEKNTDAVPVLEDGQEF